MAWRGFCGTASVNRLPLKASRVFVALLLRGKANGLLQFLDGHEDVPKAPLATQASLWVGDCGLREALWARCSGAGGPDTAPANNAGL